MNLDITDSTFVKDLKDSDKYVDLAIDYFLRLEYRVVKPVTKIRPDVSVRNLYSDRGDFKVIGMDKEYGQGWVDVKHLSYSFPLPYDDIFICTKGELGKWLYFLIDRDAKQAMYIFGNTFREWKLVSTMACGGPRSETKERRMRSFYTAPKYMFETVKL